MEEFDEATKTFVANRDRQQSVSSIFMKDEEIELLFQAMDECLDENGQKILMLRVVDGLSIRQIAEQLRLTYDQVRYKFEMSVSKLQQKLGHQN